MRRIALFMAIAAIAAGAQAQTRRRAVANTVVHHEPPQGLRVDGSPFTAERTQCVPRPGDAGHLDCRSGPLAQAGCDEIFVNDQLGGLDAPIAVCRKFSFGPLPPDDYVRGPRGFAQVYERYVIYGAGGYQLIRNVSELRARFAPILTPREALSFAVAVTGIPAVFGVRQESGFRYFVSALEDTEVMPSDDGFLVQNLFDYKAFGCGPHPTWLVTVSVTTDGNVTELQRVRAYENPVEDRLCVD